jgi:glycosyltransferase involved in cell wall biosynthesis
MKIEVIVPMLNEYECIDEFISRIKKVKSELIKDSVDLDLLIVDDGSDVKFKTILSNINKTEEFVKIITLTRNFGHQAAIRAGIDNSKSDAVITIDGDLQDPPELILEMVDLWKKGADHVSTIRSERKSETFIKKITASIYYYILDNSSNFKSTRNAGDYKLISNWIVNEIKNINEHNLYIRGFIDWLGGSVSRLNYSRDARFGGDKKYNYSQSIKVALNGLVGFSEFFPKLLNKIFYISISGSLFIIFWIFRSLFVVPESLIPGWSSIILTLFLILIIQTFSFIFITFYIRKIFEQTSGKKNYIVSQ